MKKKSTKSIYIILFISFFSIPICLAQDASMRGIITSSTQKEGLVGVNIIVDGTIYGTISGIHGDYILKNIPTGKHTIVFSFIGYETHKIDVDLEADQEFEYNLELKPGSIDLSTVTIEARRPFSAASSKAIRDFDLKIKPTRSAQEILSLVPGLFIAQHAGGGKAEQIFMRGFDADHGTDVGIYVDGLPVNMVTHGHGQGYADLHFIIPEIIDGLTVYKGPYFSEFGNFGTAGSVDLTTTDHPENNLVKLEGGMFNTLKATTVLKIPTNGKHQSAYVAGQFYNTDGPLESAQDFQRANIYGKFHTHITQRSELGIAMSAFSSAWNASGQIPERAIYQGLITRWGAIDDLEGGTTGRYNISVDYHFMQGYDYDFIIQAYFSKYDFKLYSNFTFWLNDSINGDMIEQNDHRTIYGINTLYSINKSIGNIRSLTKFGASYRGDNIELSLWKSPDRNRLSVQSESSIKEMNMAFRMEENLIFSPRFKIQFGLRGDYFTFDVLDHLEYPEFPGNGLPHASGYSQAFIMSPKLNMVWSPIKQIDVYINGGTGFHSNDARDIIIANRIREIIHAGENRGASHDEIEQELINRNFDPEHQNIETLPRASGGEIGTRVAIGKNILLSVAGWYLHMEEELVFVGDEGTTEISGQTRRLGIDGEIRLQITKWIWGDLDVNFADGRYIDEDEGNNYIPLAPRLTSQGGLNFLHKSGIEGAIRFRYVGDRPANEDNSVVAYGHFLTNLIFGYQYTRFKIFCQLENVFNTEWNEAQFDTESRLYDESFPVSELHFTPGNPINFQLGVSYEF
jgi:outer membrane receptor for Fe3+-dicitrate